MINSKYVYLYVRTVYYEYPVLHINPNVILWCYLHCLYYVTGGIIEDRLISKNDLVEYSKLPSLDIVRSQLCSVLQSAGSCFVGQLNQNQQMLVSHLEKHVEIQNAPSNSTDNPDTNEKSESTQ